MTFINEVEPSLARREEATIRPRSLTAFKIEESIRFLAYILLVVVLLARVFFMYLLFDLELGHSSCGYQMCNTFYFQVYIIGGDGTQKGASVIFEVITFLRM